MNVKNNKTFHYNLSNSKIKLLEKDGGSVPLLLAGLASLVGLITAGSTVANSVIKAKNDSAAQQETERYNKELEAIAKEGSSLFLNPFKYDRNGIKEAVKTIPHLRVLTNDKIKKLNRMKNIQYMQQSFIIYLFKMVCIGVHSLRIKIVPQVPVLRTINLIVLILLV